MCISSQLFYSAQLWEVTAGELRKIESIQHGFLLKMVNNGFKRKNFPEVYFTTHMKVKSKRTKQSSKVDVPGPDDLGWSYIYSNDQLKTIIKTAKYRQLL